MNWSLIVQMHLPKGTVFGNEKLKNIDDKIKKLLNKEVIVKTKSCPEEFISNIFTRLKKDESHRLNLKDFLRLALQSHVISDWKQMQGRIGN